jgi:type IV secretory pathway TrbF-like protein
VREFVLQRAFGRLVLVVAIVLGLYFVVTHYHGGGCEVASGVVAHADTAGACATVGQAATDPSWAQKQQASIRSQYLTTGRYFTNDDATVRTVTSGWTAGLSDRAADILRISSNFPNFPKAAKPTVAADVETKIAEMMRESGATNGVVAINHPKMCDGAMGCTAAVAAILPVGSVLHVWELDATAPITVFGRAAT